MIYIFTQTTIFPPLVSSKQINRKSLSHTHTYNSQWTMSIFFTFFSVRNYYSLCHHKNIFSTPRSQARMCVHFFLFCSFSLPMKCISPTIGMFTLQISVWNAQPKHEFIVFLQPSYMQFLLPFFDLCIRPIVISVCAHFLFSCHNRVQHFGIENMNLCFLHISCQKSVIVVVGKFVCIQQKTSFGVVWCLGVIFCLKVISMVF